MQDHSAVTPINDQLQSVDNNDLHAAHHHVVFGDAEAESTTDWPDFSKYKDKSAGHLSPAKAAGRGAAQESIFDDF
jgi:hypothetical protein